jgi:hypothetical protein
LSIVPRLWAHIASQLHEERLKQRGWNEESVRIITDNIENRKAMSLKPVTLASYALDPRFHDEQLDEDDCQKAANFIVDFSVKQGFDRIIILSELTDYRAKSGRVFGAPLIWEAVHTPTCAESPVRWWIAYANTSKLSIIAQMLLAFPATAAIVERCHKAYALQKTKLRNRLLPERASKMAMICFNLKTEMADATKLKRSTRNNILSLTVSMTSTAAESSRSENVSDDEGSTTEDDDESTLPNSGAGVAREDEQESDSDSASDIEHTDELPATHVSLIEGNHNFKLICYLLISHKMW